MGRLRLEERDEKSTERRQREHGPRIAGVTRVDLLWEDLQVVVRWCCVRTRIGYMRAWKAAGLDHKPEIWS